MGWVWDSSQSAQTEAAEHGNWEIYIYGSRNQATVAEDNRLTVCCSDKSGVWIIGSAIIIVVTI